MNKKIIIAIIVISVLTLVPMGLYFSIFNKSLSHDNQSWGAFGSFIGGIYSSVFGLISAVVLIITYNEMKKFNNDQLEHLRREKIIDDIKILCNLLDKTITKNKNIQPDREQFFSWLTSHIASYLTLHRPSDEEEVWESSIKASTLRLDLFEDEVKVFQEILYQLEFITNSELKDIAKLIIKSEMNSQERYWLECYTRRYHSQTNIYLNKWPDFSQPPTKLTRLIPDQE
ncbi:hypothetical protein [Rahnella bruchi]|uniref:hypothetical protein n=1 Tax=Rahnella bruchi TaxID=1510573 RepID=UPI000EA04ED9|nr:hypothetical protein [Rahnella bruchi]